MVFRDERGKEVESAALRLSLASFMCRDCAASLPGSEDIMIENNTAYRRSVAITNTRGASSSSSSSSSSPNGGGGVRPLRLVVLDQVPVSKDGKLRFEIAQPSGLCVGHGGVSAGVRAESGSAKDWGKATAKLKKGGGVSWDVELNAGRSVKLDLEYEVSLPSRDKAVESSDPDLGS
ncbi:hypothetical protein FJTKL_02129 [Diaporthe vaccinii]|uniref:DUF4139 domain-containing protein n=1 Tax=Diaporthe vaccinii TaxID=105482 RepID=A0ABR4DYT9_9PEZI